MDPLVQNFIYCVISIVIGIISLKVFYSTWGIIDKKWHPEKAARVKDTPSSAFKDLKNKIVSIKLKNGDVLKDMKYEKTLFFNDGEFAMNTTVYFQLISNDGKTLYISGIDIVLIEGV